MIKNIQFKYLPLLVFLYGNAYGSMEVQALPEGIIEIACSEELRGRLSSAVAYPDYFTKTGLVEKIASCRLEPEQVLKAVNQANEEYIDGTSPRPLSARFIRDTTEDMVRKILHGSPRAIETLEDKELLPASPRPSPRLDEG